MIKRQNEFTGAAITSASKVTVPNKIYCYPKSIIIPTDEEAKVARGKKGRR